MNHETYTIPADNPFINDDSAKHEIWAYGLRNPWRFSFDMINENIIIADVGQNSWEEVNSEKMNHGASKDNIKKFSSLGNFNI